MSGLKDLEKGLPTTGSRSTVFDGADVGAAPTKIDSEKSQMAADSSPLHGGEGESAFPEDKRVEALERYDEDWQHDPDNPRNW